MNFVTVFQEFKHPIYNYFLYRVGFRKEVAEELTSDLFLKVYENFETFDQSRPIKPWIYRIAHNLLANHYRDTKTEVSLYDEEGEIVIPLVSKDNTIIKTEYRMVIERLEELPSKEREMLMLRYVHDLPHEEIADILGMQPGAVRVAIHRLLKKVQNEFSE